MECPVGVEWPQWVCRIACGASRAKGGLPSAPALLRSRWYRPNQSAFHTSLPGSLGAHDGRGVEFTCVFGAPCTAYLPPADMAADCGRQGEGADRPGARTPHPRLRATDLPPGCPESLAALHAMAAPLDADAFGHRRPQKAKAAREGRTFTPSFPWSRSVAAPGGRVPPGRYPIAGGSDRPDRRHGRSPYAACWCWRRPPACPSVPPPSGPR